MGNTSSSSTHPTPAKHITCQLKEPIKVLESDPKYASKPNINGNRQFMHGSISDYKGYSENVLSPIFGPNNHDRVIIGTIAKMTSEDARNAVDSAKSGWKNGQGVWPSMSLEQRILAIQKVVESLKERREEIVNTLVWEIAKPIEDSYTEFDRTMIFVQATIEAFKEMDKAREWITVSGLYARVRRAPLGILLCLGPFNYPFNETYAALIPALLAGNVAILKLPAVGGLVHMLTMEAYAKHLPPGTMTFVSGSGAVTVSTIMQSGSIDVLAFIGGSRAADLIVRDHPHPHRLTRFLQLEGKNVGIVLPDADIKTAVDQCVLGALSFNGQRCTAIKLIMVHESIATEFVKLLSEKVNTLIAGLPWEKNVAITPLPEGYKKIEYLKKLIVDAVAKGAKIANNEINDCTNIKTAAAAVEGSNTTTTTAAVADESNNTDKCAEIITATCSATYSSPEEIAACTAVESITNHDGGSIHGLLMEPAVLFPVTKSMRIWSEEQFGPVIPVATYSDIQEVYDYYATTNYGQQASIFTQSSMTASALVDILANVVGRININTQCGRSPDVLPFSGRRASALGTMSIYEAIRVFSIEVVVTGKENEINTKIMKEMETTSQFLKPLHT